jgi:hypothetical protein
MTTAGNQISRTLSFSRFTSTSVPELKTDPVACFKNQIEKPNHSYDK